MIAINTRRGFTLIELLVVILIISILAAVALPQYQLTVYKARFATLKKTTHSLAQGEELYYLANGQYSIRPSYLDIDVPPPTLADYGNYYTTYTYPWGTCQIIIGPSNSFVSCTLTDVATYHLKLQHSGLYPGSRYCFPASTDTNTIGHKLCKSETKHALSPADNSYLYTR